MSPSPLHTARWNHGRATAVGDDASLRGARSAAVWALAAVLAGAAAAMGLTSDVTSGARVRLALMHMLVVLVPVGVGLYATRHEAHRRFGYQLIIAGIVWSSAALAQADTSVLYSVGRVCGWVVTFVLIYLILAYPTGRLPGFPERVIVAGGLVVLCVLFLPTALLVDAYPAHAPWTACGRDCPGNAFMVVGSQPGFLAAWVFPVRDVLLIVLFFATLVVIVARAVHATYLRRRTVVPVLVPFGLQLVFLIAFVVVRRTEPNASAAEPLGWLFALGVPAVALGFLAGLVRWRIYVADALERVTLAMRDVTPPRDLRATLADAVSDPSLEVAICRDGAWVDTSGEPRSEPVADGNRALTDVQRSGAVVAALIHDDALAEDPAFTSSLAACTAALLERRRMHATVGDGLRELEDLRTRLLADVDVERRRMERDLHDGVQQRLVVLGIKLGMASDRLAEGEPPGTAALREFGTEVDIIIDEIRSLSRGVHPSLLLERGLPDAIEAVAERAPLPVEVDARGIGRHPMEVETAVYFACAEALQNVVKHAQASHAKVSLRDGGALIFEVSDDGAGFREDPGQAGAGVENMRQRLTEIGGALTIESTPGAGTRVIGRVPLEPGARLGQEVVNAEPAHRAELLDPVADLPVYERILPAVPLSISRMRRELVDALDRHQLAADRRDDIALVMTEAATNAVLHAYGGSSSSPLYVGVVHVGPSLVLTVSDSGSGMRPSTNHSGVGLGMALMTGLADDLQLSSGAGGGGTSVQAIFELKGEQTVPTTFPTSSTADSTHDELLEEYLTVAVATDALRQDTGALLAQAQVAVAHARRQRRERQFAR